jgi:hypothetical protein
MGGSGEIRKGAMKILKVNSQAELDAALASKDELQIWICGTGRFQIAKRPDNPISIVVAWESSHVEARESSHVVAWESSHVEARGSSHVVARGSSHVEARESSHVVAWGSSHVEAWESSHVEARESSHVEAWESSHVEARGSSHVEARESSHVVAWESSHVVATKQVAIHRHSKLSKVKGGVVIEIEKPKTSAEWCDWYGVPVKKGVAVLFKSVSKDLKNGHDGKFQYTLGEIPVAADWDGGKSECGAGLHFSPHPSMALQFHNPPDVRFIACPVKLADMRAPREDDSYQNKVKAKGCAAPIWEVDRNGESVKATKAK